jgi:hypothetical protein
MEDRTGKTILIVFGIYILFLAATAVFYNSSLGDAGALGFYAGIMLFFIGALAIVSRKTRDIGFGLLLASLLIGIVGFGVCSANFKL